jgi:RecA/RadA recombinase
MVQRRRDKSQKVPGEVNLEEILEEKSKTQDYDPDQLFPSGINMFNLAASDYTQGAYKLGSINSIGGESDAGKTMIAYSILAATAANKKFKPWKLIMNNAEVKGSVPLVNLYPPLVGRLQEPPGGFSRTINQFGGSLLQLCKQKEPFLLVLDSLDTLKGDADFEKANLKAMQAADGNLKAIKDIQKSYNTEKAKVIKKVLGECNDAIGQTESGLIIIQQLTANVGAGQFDDSDTTSGGRSPRFNSTHQHWIYLGSKIDKTINGRKIQIGQTASVRCKKNHLNGKIRHMAFKIFDEYGIDDIECTARFLAENRWTTSVSRGSKITNSVKITASEFSKTQIEFGKLVDLLWEDPKKNTEIINKLSQETWNEIESKLCTGRRRIF